MTHRSLLKRLRHALAAFGDGYRAHMAYPAKGRREAVRTGLYRARTYLHNTSRHWPGCNCEMHRRDKWRHNPYDAG